MIQSSGPSIHLNHIPIHVSLTLGFTRRTERIQRTLPTCAIYSGTGLFRNDARDNTWSVRRRCDSVVDA
jgi:hypothetical protein